MRNRKEYLTAVLITALQANYKPYSKELIETGKFAKVRYGRDITEYVILDERALLTFIDEGPKFASWFKLRNGILERSCFNIANGKTHSQCWIEGIEDVSTVEANRRFKDFYEKMGLTIPVYQ